MQKVYAWVAPVLLCLVAIAIMNFVYYYKLNSPTDFEFALNQLEQQIKINDWSSARQNLTQAEQDWNQLLPYIQFSSERDKMEAIEDHLARLKAALQMENPDTSLGEVYSILQSWTHITN